MGRIEQWDEKNGDALRRANVEMSNERSRKAANDQESKIVGPVAGIFFLVGLVAGFWYTGGEGFSILARLGFGVLTGLGIAIPTVALMSAAQD